MIKAKKYIRKGIHTLKEEGVLELGIKSLKKMQKVQAQKSIKSNKKIKFISLVKKDDVLRSNWPGRIIKKSSKKYNPPYHISWIMSPPGGGGGHQNIFRFIDYLDKKGHINKVYLYSNLEDANLRESRKNVSQYCSAKNLEIKLFNEKIEETDLLFATGWETAYPVLNSRTKAVKAYFVQDFEPLFYPMGTNYVLAENTYKFGFHGITAGGWLYNKLSNEYGMKCDYYDFGSNPNHYKFINNKDRKEIFFYARPVTERRGFDLGVMALELFHKKHPEYVINLAGWDVSDYDITFPYINHGAVEIEELHKIYNKCAAALVISLTNMSLLPLELLSCGTIPVVNDGQNNRMVSNNKYIHYTSSSPHSLAKELSDVVLMRDLRLYSKKASDSVKSLSWDESGKKFVNIVEELIANG